MDNGTLKRELRPLELRSEDGTVIESDLRPLTAKDRQNMLWRTVRTKIFIKGTNEEYR